MFLLTQGHTSDRIDDMHLDDFQLVWQGLRAELFGPVAEAKSNYNLISYLHYNGNRKEGSLPSFATHYPVMNAMSNLNELPDRPNFTDQSVMAFGVPKWARERYGEE